MLIWIGNKEFIAVFASDKVRLDGIGWRPYPAGIFLSKVKHCSSTHFSLGDALKGAIKIDHQGYLAPVVCNRYVPCGRDGLL